MRSYRKLSYFPVQKSPCEMPQVLLMSFAEYWLSSERALSLILSKACFEAAETTESSSSTSMKLPYVTLYFSSRMGWFFSTEARSAAWSGNVVHSWKDRSHIPSWVPILAALWLVRTSFLLFETRAVFRSIVSARSSRTIIPLRWFERKARGAFAEYGDPLSALSIETSDICNLSTLDKNPLHFLAHTLGKFSLNWLYSLREKYREGNFRCPAHEV